MTRIAWDKVGERRYETGVDHGVLYLRDENGDYTNGYAWNGLTTVTESPSGAESSKTYADNIPYLNLKSAEEFGATIEALYYPDEFMRCDGTAEPEQGVYLGQQGRETFGFSYRSLIGNDLVGNDYGSKIHLVYGADANPSEKARSTVNDAPEPTAFSWEVTTTPVEVGTVNGKEYRPTSHLIVDSTKVSAAGFAALQDALYGTAGSDPRLPMPGEVLAMFAGTITVVETVAPTYDAGTDTVTVPSTPGVTYMVGGEVVSGSFTISEDTVVRAVPADGYRFTDTSDTDWTMNYS